MRQPDVAEPPGGGVGFGMVPAPAGDGSRPNGHDVRSSVLGQVTDVAVGGEPSKSLPAGEHTQVVRGSIWFVASVSMMAVGGFAYWSVATHVASADLGKDAGVLLVSQAGFLFTALIFVNYATSLGLPVAVARFAPANTRSVNVMFNWALVLTTASSLVGTLVFFGAAIFAFPDQNTAPLFAWGKPFGLGLFFLLVTGQSFAILVEVRLVTMRRWRLVLGRVVVVILLRFPLFLIPSLRDNPVGLLVIMGGTPALSGFVGIIVLRRMAYPQDRAWFSPLPPDWRVMLMYSMVNFGGMLAAQNPQFGLPLIVSKFEPGEYGAFYLAWTIVTVVFLVPHTTGQTVLAEASRDRATVGRQTKLGMAVAGSITVSLSIGAFLLAGPAIGAFFGSDYQLTADILPRMVFAAVPWTITAMLLARVRVLHQFGATIAITAGFAICTIVPVGELTARDGVEGAANAWLLGNIAAAVIAVVATAVSRSDARRSTAEADTDTFEGAAPLTAE